MDKVLTGILAGLGAARVPPWLVHGDRFSGQPFPALCATDGTRRALLLVADARPIGGKSRPLAWS
jgi:hypothetical protein